MAPAAADTSAALRARLGPHGAAVYSCCLSGQPLRLSDGGENRQIPTQSCQSAPPTVSLLPMVALAWAGPRSPPLRCLSRVNITVWSMLARLASAVVSQHSVRRLKYTPRSPLGPVKGFTWNAVACRTSRCWLSPIAAQASEGV